MVPQEISGFPLKGALKGHRGGAMLSHVGLWVLLWALVMGPCWVPVECLLWACSVYNGYIRIPD